MISLGTCDLGLGGREKQFITNYFAFSPQKLQDVTLMHSKSHKKRLLLLPSELNVQSAKHEWYHNGRKISSCQDYKILRALDREDSLKSDVRASLLIAQCGLEDSGVYTCFASNEAGNISTSCYVSFKGKLHVSMMESVFKSERLKFIYIPHVYIPVI